MRKLVLLLGLGLVLLTSCVKPARGCWFVTIESFEFGSVITERVDAWGNVTIIERPRSQRFEVCTIEEELELHRIYNGE